MKKFLTLICMIACIFGLTACGGDEPQVLTEYETLKVTDAKNLATSQVIPIIALNMDDEAVAGLNEYTLDEITDIMSNGFGLNMSGYVTKTAIESFRSAATEMGEMSGEFGEVTARIDDDTIIVEVAVQGEKKDAVVEIIFSNDSFLNVESVSMNPVSTMGDLMIKAALNTLIGMGTVFAVLILISLIISCFGVIPKIQANMAKKKSAEAVVESAAAQSAVQEETVDETDDLELVAVIAAAVAACQGAASTDGFVVRSIRRRA